MADVTDRLARGRARELTRALGDLVPSWSPATIRTALDLCVTLDQLAEIVIAAVHTFDPIGRRGAELPARTVRDAAREAAALAHSRRLLAELAADRAAAAPPEIAHRYAAAARRAAAGQPDATLFDDWPGG